MKIKAITILLSLAIGLLPLAVHSQTTYTLSGNICASADCQCDTLGNCKQSFPAGMSVLLTPQAKAGYEFVGWIGEGLKGTKPVSITMSQDRRVMAIFEVITYRNLYVIGYGAGSGTVVSVPVKITGINTVKQFPADSKVTLTATPAPDSVFVGWRLSVGTCSGVGTCTVSMTRSKIVTANFNKK